MAVWIKRDFKFHSFKFFSDFLIGFFTSYSADSIVLYTSITLEPDHLGLSSLYAAYLYDL